MENGLADAQDKQRSDFILKHLSYLHHALENGLDVRGYFHWSLLDNFEWSEGYAARFGLVYTDFKPQLRTIKNSGYWFRDFLAGK